MSTPPVTALSSNAIAIVYGSNLAAAGTLGVSGAGNLVDGQVSTELDGSCVLVGGTRAPILAVTPSQINFQVPQVSSSGTVQVQVVTGCGTSGAITSAPATVTVQSATPEFLYFTQTSTGQNPIAAVDASTGVNVGPANLLPGAAFAPAKPGDLVTLYATGLGATSPGFAAGALPSAAGAVTGAFQISVGSVTLASTDVLYAGVAPDTAGLYQINIHLPSTIANGNQPVSMLVNGIASPTGGYIAVHQ